MIQFRPFRNTDPPSLAEIWCSQPPLRALMQPMSPDILERFVFAKPYFERDGLVVAADTDGPVGFVHVGFSGCPDGSTLSRDFGSICALMVARHEQDGNLGADLLGQAEEYLRSQGATHWYGGAVRPANAFYLGLYGGSDQSGVLASHEAWLELLDQAGYQRVERRSIMHRSLRGYRPAVDRAQMQIRRGHKIDAELDPTTENWWDACTVGPTDRTRFTMTGRRDPSIVGIADFWDIEPLAGSWGVPAVGVMGLQIHTEDAPHEKAHFLVGEALRQLATRGATLAEVHLRNDDPYRAVFESLGFAEVEASFVMQKTATGDA